MNYAQIGQISPVKGDIKQITMVNSMKKTKILRFFCSFSAFLDLIIVSPGGGINARRPAMAQGGERESDEFLRV